jgi:hypothetical protein
MQQHRPATMNQVDVARNLFRGFLAFLPGRACQSIAPFLLALAGLFWVLPARALQPDIKLPANPKLRILFSANPVRATNTSHDLRLRPNVQQTSYLYLENQTDTAQAAVVELRINGGVVADGVQRLSVPPGAPVRVRFGKPPAAGAAPAKPAEPAPVEGNLTVRVSVAVPMPGMPGKEKLEIQDISEVGLATPTEYTEITRIQYFPEERKLEVRVRASATFSGPPARVRLELRPDRIPSLLPGQKKDGTYAGFLRRPGDELLLVARNLQFNPAADVNPNGLVYLTIDGHERAYTYLVTFTGSQPRQPQLITTPVVRLRSPRYAKPSAEYPVEFELDNLPPGAVAELGFDRNDNTKFEARQGEISRFPSDRQTQILFSPAGPNGSLLFRTVVKDWTLPLNTEEIYNLRALWAWVSRSLANPTRPEALPPEQRRCSEEVLSEVVPSRINRDGQFEAVVLPILDSGEPIRVEAEKVVEVCKVNHRVTLDDSPPENVAFLKFPKKLQRGAPLPLQARGGDPESGISQVVFFSGKPTPEGKLAPDAIVAKGEPGAEKGVWLAKLDVPTQEKGKVEVTVQLTNGAGLKTAKTVVIQLVDAPKEGEKPTGIEGTVTQGGLPQPGVTVNLLGTSTDAVVASTTTNEAGEFKFEKLTPGAYRVSASKPSSLTAGQTTVQVVADEIKKGVEIPLFRIP